MVTLRIAVSPVNGSGHTRDARPKNGSVRFLVTFGGHGGFFKHDYFLRNPAQDHPRRVSDVVVAQQRPLHHGSHFRGSSTGGGILRRRPRCAHPRGHRRVGGATVALSLATALAPVWLPLLAIVGLVALCLPKKTQTA